MERILQLAAGFSIAISAVAIFVAFVGGSVMQVLVSLFSILALSDVTPGLGYPLGNGVFAIYLSGIVLGVVALRWPVAAGGAMLPLGACAFVFGGSVAQAYGIAIICTGFLLVGIGWRRSAR